MSTESILALHIPDGFLSVPVAAFGWLLTIILVTIALRQTQDQLGERQVPLMGILAAFVFAAQMINFPVAGGTSGHLLGGLFIAILLGPWSAVLVMTSVIAVQSLLFQDGGLLAMGFNIFNMGIVAVFVGYFVYSWIGKLWGNTWRSRLIGAAAGAWLGVEVAAIATALQLGISGTSAFSVALPAMAGIHALIGLGEAAITLGALTFINQSRPDLVRKTSHNAQGSGWVALGLLIVLAIILFSPLADPNPDGLERVAEDNDFAELAEAPPYEILPDYTVPIIENEQLTTIIAGIVGILIVMGTNYGIARFNRRKTIQAADTSQIS